MTWSLILIIGLLGFAFLVGLGILLVDHSRTYSLKELLASGSNSLWVVPILGAVGWIFWQVGPYLSSSPLERNTKYIAGDHTFDASPSTAAVSPNLEADNDLPAWVTSGQRNNGDVVIVPVNGGWRQSQDEALNHAAAQAAEVLHDDFRRSYPGARQWRVPVVLDDLKVLGKEHVESREMDLGSVKATMYRVHLEVELTDAVREVLASTWATRLGNYRLQVMSCVAGLLTLVFLAGSLCLRYDIKTNGHYRTWLRLATVCFVIGTALSTQQLLEYTWFLVSV